MARAGNGLEAWIRRSWPDGAPPLTHDAFAELYAEEQQQAAAERAERLEAQKLARLERENADLRRRVARLERHTGPGGVLIGALADAVPRLIEQNLERGMVMRYAGTWHAERDYPAGATVTHAGAVWCATQPIAKGVKPGQGETAWRLAAKGEQKPTVR